MYGFNGHYLNYVLMYFCFKILDMLTLLVSENLWKRLRRPEFRGR